jgi:uncharacterized low-complexity protein
VKVPRKSYRKKHSRKRTNRRRLNSRDQRGGSGSEGSGSGKAGSGKAGSGKAGSGKAGSGKAGSGKAGSGSSDADALLDTVESQRLTGMTDVANEGKRIYDKLDSEIQERIHSMSTGAFDVGARSQFLIHLEQNHPDKLENIAAFNTITNKDLFPKTDKPVAPYLHLAYVIQHLAKRKRRLQKGDISTQAKFAFGEDGGGVFANPWPVDEEK